jgi:hypothetical protein
VSRATPKVREWAESLIVYEASLTPSASSDATTPLSFPVTEKLRPRFAMLMGSIGFRSLLGRALALAATEVPWLRAVQVRADSTFEGLDVHAAKLPLEEVTEGRVVLIAQLLGLLVALIGENLTLRLLGDVWPGLSLDDLDLGAGAKNEKAQ